jgi:diaminopimelate epimerase
MSIQFFKYHGAGNDFIIIDNRNNGFKVQRDVIERLCNRRFGIGADGLMLLENSRTADFSMRYFNADGRESTMCGNGGRCIVAFANSIGVIKNDTRFMAADGLHKAKILDTKIVSIEMKDIEEVRKLGNDYFVDTGSPHYVQFVNDLKNAPVYTEGRRIRLDRRICNEGTNVNFVHIDGDGRISIRTYERGVENETLACGTGAVASAISTFLKTKTDKTSFMIHVVGGKLKVDFVPVSEQNYKDIWLTGPAEFVFEGMVEQ